MDSAAHAEPITEAPPLPRPLVIPTATLIFCNRSASNLDEKVFKGERGLWRDVVKHPNYDEFWQARNLRPI